jgi:Uma2 family endonuclease
MNVAARKIMTQAEFLDWEAEQATRYEYDRGVVRAMTGGTQAHDRVRGAIFASLRTQLRGTPCRAHLDVRVVCRNSNVRYPDAAVDCGPYNPKGLDLTEPRLVVEVLSPSTQATDYMVKTEDYGSVESITAYWIVSAEEPRIDVISRIDGKLKLTATIEGRESEISAKDLGVTLKFSDIFE